jgi:hypothetical protein
MMEEKKDAGRQRLPVPHRYFGLALGMSRRRINPLRLESPEGAQAKSFPPHPFFNQTQQPLS